MRAMTDYPGIEYYAKADFQELCAEVDKKWALDPQLIDMDITEEWDDDTNTITYYITGIFQIEDLKFSLTYTCLEDPDEIELEFDEIDPVDLHDAYRYRELMSLNMKHDAEDFKHRLQQKGLDVKIYSSRKINASTPVFAADEDDPFADMGFDDEMDPDLSEDDDLGDNIDDMADTLDEMSEALKDLDEDDVDIETENNIADHYIAECEKCHNVFISAVLVSDQKIEKISGTCPICDEECDQYLKWVVKEI